MIRFLLENRIDLLFLKDLGDWIFWEVIHFYLLFYWGFWYHLTRLMRGERARASPKSFYCLIVKLTKFIYKIFLLGIKFSEFFFQKKFPVQIFSFGRNSSFSFFKAHTLTSEKSVNKSQRKKKDRWFKVNVRNQKFQRRFFLFFSKKKYWEFLLTYAVSIHYKISFKNKPCHF